MMYWKIGERIFEEEQKGEEKAEYGAGIITELAEGKKRAFFGF
jgi:hypothetical protein